jgi:thioredoxin 1
MANSAIPMISDDSFAGEVTQAGTPVLIDFMADWCKPCKIMAPIFAELAPEYAGRVKFVKMNADDNPETIAALGVLNLPTFMLLNGKTVLATGFGTKSATSLRSWLDQGLAKVNTPANR